MDEAYPSGERILSEIGARVAAAAHVNSIFGEPRQVGDITLVPVASMTSLFAGGGGGGAGKQGNSGAGGGGGGLAGLGVRPVAVVQVTASGAAVQPIIDWTRVFLALIAAMGAFLGLRGLRRLIRG